MFGDDDKDDVFPRPKKEKEHLPWLDEVPAEMAEEALGDNKQRIMLIAGSLVVILLFGSLVVYIYNQNSGANNPQSDELLLVHAPDGPTKVEPQDRGGIDVPDQDRVVFDAVTGEDSQSGENVRSGPEQPLERPQDTAETTDQGGADNTPATQTETTAQPAQQDNSPAPQTQTPIQTTPAETQPAAQPAAQAPAGPDFTGKYMVQMGAFGNQTAAQNAWGLISASFPTALGGLFPNYEGVQRNGTTALYRLRAGPIDTRQEADSICDRLKASAQACFVVSP